MSHEKSRSSHHECQRSARETRYLLYSEANCYKCTLWVEKDDRKVNAKSLLGVLSLGIAKGMTVTLIADGQDEDAALDGLTALINSGFAE